jgi:hypothetical protein
VADYVAPACVRVPLERDHATGELAVARVPGGAQLAELERAGVRLLFYLPRAPRAQALYVRAGRGFAPARPADCAP